MRELNKKKPTVSNASLKDLPFNRIFSDFVMFDKTLQSFFSKLILFYYIIMDNLVYEESMTAEQTSSEFISKKWMFVNDNNVGNYSNQVVIDTTPLTNAGAYVGWNEGYILMPLVVQLTSTLPANLPTTAGAAGFSYPTGSQSWAFKNGFWQMIHSMSVEFNNGNAVSQYPFLNVFASFKAQTSFSDADVFNHGDGIGFYMDNAESFTYQSNSTPTTSANYSATSAGDGVGLCNNKSFPEPSFTSPYYVATGAIGAATVIPTIQQAGLTQSTDNQGIFNTTGGTSVKTQGKTYPNSDTEYNAGMRQRQKAINRDYNQNTSVPLNGNYSYTGQEQLMPISSLQQVWATGAVQQNVVGLKAWNIYAKLRLKDLSDFFHKVPLLKGATMRFIMNTNQAITTFVVGNGANTAPLSNIGTTTTVAPVVPTTLNTLTSIPTLNPLIYTTAVNVIGGMTNPLMVASNAIGQGSGSLTAGTYQLSVSIVKCNFTDQGAFSGLANTALQSCRLYAPLYKFDPVCESRYLSQKTKTITYKDVVSYQFTSIPSQNNFNVLVSQGMKNICSVLTVPYIASGQNGINPSTGAFWNNGLLSSKPSTLLSPFSTSGATPDPVILNNFNVQIDGVNQFLQDEMYDFEAFKHQLIASNQLNGNLTTGLTSGLINEKMFSYLYRYYYTNCERELPTVKGKERSIQVKGRNLCSLPIDLLIFVEYEREMVIDIATGQRVG